MGILERTRHAVRADLNDLVRKARNPELVLEAYLDDLRAVEEEALGLRAAEVAERDLYLSKLRDARAAQTTWESKARACLEHGDVELARSALGKKLDLQDEARELAIEVEQREASLAILEDSLEALRLRLREVARKQRDLRFRRQMLQARSELQSALQRVDRGQDEPVVSEASDGLTALESNVEALEDLGGADLDERSLKLEAAARRRRREASIDEELARLKRAEPEPR
ncbi:MAG TPA: PspA/IM30 family protein [Myxococcota bacterium]|nr:PspA/IM30 family protein [Myxococcota bacterium]HRY96343.1 PspA/IM30 family protein [Myxococcota bacterium]HSA24126.1 PspA/IM30 family protein [Myxococcota bacterium]